MRDSRPILATSALIAVSLLCAGIAQSKERLWYKYENAYFEVYSNANEKPLRRFLESLENFRAASLQMLSFEIPDGAVKTQVVVFSSRPQFQAIVEDKNIAAVMVGMDDAPYMVLPLTRGRGGSDHFLRHEYTHVLLAYSPHRFPPWYHEGFAEFMSGTEFKKKGTVFTLGDEIDRVLVGRKRVPWNELLSDNYNLHAQPSGELGSNAYYQAWILTHYLMIGNNFENYPALGRYLGRFAAGEASVAAFKAEFGREPSEVAEQALTHYSNRMPYYEIPFKPGAQDHDFVRTGTDRDEMATLIDQLRRRWQSGP